MDRKAFKERLDAVNAADMRLDHDEAHSLEDALVKDVLRAALAGNPHWEYMGRRMIRHFDITSPPRHTS